MLNEILLSSTSLYVASPHIGDSFGLPVEDFLSTAFRRVETLDLRYVKDTTAAEVLDRFQPDMVIVMYNPFVMEGECLQFGLGGG